LKSCGQIESGIYSIIKKRERDMSEDALGRKDIAENAMSKTANKADTVSNAYLSNQPALGRYVRRLLGSRYRAEDVDDFTQEVFVRAFAAKKSERLDYPKAYLFRVARNLVIKSGMRKTSPLEMLMEDFEIDGIIDSRPPQDVVVHEKSRLEAFYRAADRLPKQCRTALLLRQLEGLTHKQISKRMEISTSTVEKHLAKGLRLCIKYMNEDGYDAGKVIKVEGLNLKEAGK
jgi:RNA polymerase sigma-70 factor (ECF subfamily)